LVTSLHNRCANTMPFIFLNYRVNREVLVRRHLKRGLVNNIPATVKN
jgi:hypothetical protein